MSIEPLVVEVRAALAHLDDPPCLETLQLARQIGQVSGAASLSNGQALRRALRLAIAALDPTVGQGKAALQSRAYDVLYRYAVGKQGMIAIGAELGISSRQAYRELQRGTEAVAEILADMLRDSGRELGGGARGSPSSDLREELGRLASGHLQEVQVGELVTSVVRDARQLAGARGATIDLSLPDEPLTAVVNRVMLRQAILNLLSHMVASQQDGPIAVQVLHRGRDAVLRFRYHPQGPSETSHSTSPYAVARALLDSLGIEWQHQDAGGGLAELSIALPLVREYALLIVDDNPDMLQLYLRYLRNEPYRVRTAPSFEDAYRLWRDLQPDVVVVDVMMPDRDGWELVQVIRAQGGPTRSRIIVCSIIDDPELAAALGADAFLHKPIDRQHLLQALESVIASGA